MIEFDFATLEKRLRELAFLNSGLRIHLRDERHGGQEAQSALLAHRLRETGTLKLWRSEAGHDAARAPGPCPCDADRRPPLGAGLRGDRGPARGRLTVAAPFTLMRAGRALP